MSYHITAVVKLLKPNPADIGLLTGNGWTDEASKTGAGYFSKRIDLPFIGKTTPRKIESNLKTLVETELKNIFVDREIKGILTYQFKGLVPLITQLFPQQLFISKQAKQSEKKVHVPHPKANNSNGNSNTGLEGSFAQMGLAGQAAAGGGGGAAAGGGGGGGAQAAPAAQPAAGFNNLAAAFGGMGLGHQPPSGGRRRKSRKNRKTSRKSRRR